MRAARAGDLARVAEIYAHYVLTSVVTFETEPPSVADWEHKLAAATERSLPFLVAEAGGAVCGYAYATPWRPRPAYQHTAEDSVYVAPGLAGRGIGSALLSAVLGYCAETGVRQVIAVIADSGSDASAALHAKLGFTVAGRLTAVGRKHDRWLDTLLMQRPLP